jgi:ABC-type dipeptide/oligopeptide/nickel transport system permease component
MFAFITRRIGYSLLILLGVTFITYLLLFMLPADPARQIAGRSATPEVVAGIRTQLGLDCRSIGSTPTTWATWCKVIWGAPISSAAR